MGVVYRLKKNLTPERNVTDKNIAPYKERNKELAGSPYFYDVYKELFAEEQKDLQKKYLALMKSKDYLIIKLRTFKYQIINYQDVEKIIPNIDTYKKINDIKLRFFTIKTDKENLEDKFRFLVGKLIRVNVQLLGIKQNLIENDVYTVGSKIRFSYILRSCNLVIAEEIKKGKKLVTNKVGTLVLLKYESNNLVDWYRTGNYKKELQDLNVELAKYHKVEGGKFEIVNEGQNYILKSFNCIKLKSKWNVAYAKGSFMKCYKFKFSTHLLRAVYTSKPLMDNLRVSVNKYKYDGIQNSIM
jgi:hypothetical protein